MSTVNPGFPRRVVVLMLCYGTQFVSDALSAVRDVCCKMFPGTPMMHVIVDNSLENHMSQEGGGWTIAGDNSDLEFSGWDTGYRVLRDSALIEKDDLILFVNDTIHRRAYSVGGSAYLEVFNRDLIQGQDLSVAAIGYIDDFPKPVELMGMSYDRWIRSNIFLLPKSIADTLHPLTFPLPKDYVFGSVETGFWNDIPEISENWRAYISSWLFGIEDPRYPEYRLKWIKCSPLSEANAEFFKKKAVAILSEHYLTARLIHRGVRIIDANVYPKSPDRHLAPYYE